MPVSPAEPPRLYLVDIMGYIFRAFHALPPMQNARGLPTQAVLGVVMMLRRLLAEHHPEAIVAVFDLAGPTFRDERFAAYKANRAAMPEPLAPQLPYIRRALDAFRIPVLEFAGYEADDVIGTMAQRAAEAGTAVTVVSSDKDLLQLVTHNVRLFNPSSNLWYDPAQVEAKLGVQPSQVADYLALRGDAVDNIPGAPGIGEKGAQQLIVRFGSVEAALERAAEVERKTYRESLQQHRDQILLSKHLATIATDVPLEFTPDAWRCQEPDAEACRALFTELEFHHLLAALPGAPATTAGPAAPAATEAWQEAELAAFLAASAGEPVALAFADSGARGEATLPTIADAAGLATSSRAGWIAPALSPCLAAALGDPARRWQVHDARALRQRLARLELPPLPLEAERLQDVSLLAYLDDPTASSFELTALARRYGLGGEVEPADAGQRAALAAALAAHLRPRVEASLTWPVYRDLDLPLVGVLEAMEAHGVALDPVPLQALAVELDRRALECQEQVFELAGERFNLNSPQQLAHVLFEKMGLPAPPRRGKTRAFSTAQDVLEGLTGYPVVPPLLEYRQLSKLKSTYVDALPPLAGPDGRLRTHWNIAGSATGRLASSNPNLQNIPIRTELGRSIRAAFVAAPGYRLLAADYSQIELRLLAHLSQDPLLLAAYRQGQDIHALTAAEVFEVPPLLLTSEHRRRAKAVNFGIVYGLSAFGLARQLGIPQGEAARFIQRYFARYAGVQAWIQRSLAEARSRGWVATLHGRRRPIPNLESRNPTLRGFAERTAINSPLQGTAADLIKLAMIRLHPQLAALDARLLLQVHDELVLEAPVASIPALAALVRHEMEAVADLSVPLQVAIEAGPNWRDLEPLSTVPAA
ncbi:MAG: DNA polymerase I [Terriglobales bacterium]